jgi:hypothetical protein
VIAGVHDQEPSTVSLWAGSQEGGGIGHGHPLRPEA